MRWRLFIAGVLLAGIVLLVAYLFVVQNSGRTTQLSLDLALFPFMSGLAWQLREPVSVMALMGCSFAIGLAFAVPFALRSSRLASRVRALERQSALQDAGTDPWR